MELPDLRQLRIFSALVETGSFTAAAEKLFLTQSAVSHSIKSLESQMECQLVRRLGKTIALTQAGERLLSHARTILAQVEAAMEDVTTLLRPGYGRLRVGATQTICHYILPAVIREFRECFPHCEVAIHPGDTAELLEFLESGKIDIALGLRFPKMEPLEFRPLFADELACIFSPLYPLSEARRIRPQDLRHEKLIVYSKSSLTTRLIENHFRQNQVPLPPLIELGNMEAIKEFAKIGVGVGIVAPWIAEKELEEKSLQARTLGPGNVKREWGVLRLANRKSNIIEDNFTGLCETVCQALTAV